MTRTTWIRGCVAGALEVMRARGYDIPRYDPKADDEGNAIYDEWRDRAEGVYQDLKITDNEALADELECRLEAELVPCTPPPSEDE